ncbi:MAG: alkaline phosphatase, partial [Kiritimatiellae bacterium]|nr:alkaline phosphatase [Kiritimatiellia bacterium]
TALESFAVDTAFQGADGIGDTGELYTADMQLAQVDRSIRARAHHTYVLADSSKIGRTALVQHGHLREVTAWITDTGVGESRLRYERLGIRVIVAG